jgi:outer membrane protein
MMNRLLLRAVLILGLTNLPMAGQALNPQQEWGLGGVFRNATIPFATDGSSNHVGTFIPMIFFEGEHVFLYGTEGGVRVYRQDTWELSAIYRLRFFDIPRQYQNDTQGDKTFWGAQFKFRPDNNFIYDAEVLADEFSNFQLIGRFAYQFGGNGWGFRPHFEARYNSSDLHSTYYALNQFSIDGGFELNVGFRMNYHIASNFYLYGAGSITRLAGSVQSSQFIDDDYSAEVLVGIALSNDNDKPKKSNLRNTPYVRVAHAWGTPSSMSDIMTGTIKDDPYNHQLSSIFYGHPLSDDLFGLPIDIYLTGGFAWHYASEKQDDIQEFIVAIKLYYTIPLPVRLRLGAAEGLSQITEVTYIESSTSDKDGYKPSKRMNYLDFSLDVSLGDIFGGFTEPIWLGATLHHRSGIFESAQMFGRIMGGSNYVGGYLQYHL